MGGGCPVLCIPLGEVGLQAVRRASSQGRQARLFNQESLAFWWGYLEGLAVLGLELERLHHVLEPSESSYLAHLSDCFLL